MATTDDGIEYDWREDVRIIELAPLGLAEVEVRRLTAHIERLEAVAEAARRHLCAAMGALSKPDGGSSADLREGG